MGESGEGSLEPGVASGDTFWLAYQQPFLKHYNAAHPDRLPDGHPDKPKPQPKTSEPEPGAGDGDVPTAEARLVPTGLPTVKQDAPVYGFYSLDLDELSGKPGPNHGKRQQVWTCAIRTPDEPCCASRTLTFKLPGQAPSNSNMVTHIRDEAKKGCPYHAEALKVIDEGSKNQVLVDGEYKTVFSFEEAFSHHIDYPAQRESEGRPPP
eukprot:3006745-Prymnesium_polylepis.1